MLDGVGLIHMHGRVYDPTMGRFLSVDPVVRDTAASQSWNGYGYVEGRMLSATDPDGFTTDVNCPSCNKPVDPALETVIVEARRRMAEALRSAEVALGLDLARLTRPSLGGVPVNEGLETVEVTASAIRGGGGAGGGGTNGGDGDRGEDSCRAVNAIADSAGGAVAGLTFALYTANFSLAIPAAIGGAVVAGVARYYFPSGGMGAFTAALYTGVAVAASGGTSSGGFASIVAGAAGAATPTGALSVPIGMGTGAIVGAIAPAAALGRVASGIIGGSAGGMAAVAGLATSEIISGVWGCGG